MNEAETDTLFLALASQPRRRVLDLIKNDPATTVGTVCETLQSEFAISRVAALKHLKVLEDAALITRRKEGREKKLFFNPTPIQLIHDRWSDEFSQFWTGALANFKYAVETRQSEDTPEPKKPTKKPRRASVTSTARRARSRRTEK